MRQVEILHKGWRANDTLLECPNGYILTYFTHTKQEGVASFREGLFLYKNSRVFPNKYVAKWFYYERVPRRKTKTSFDATEERVDDIIYKRGKGVK